MNPKDITAIAIRFFAIYLLVNTVVYVPSMIVSMTMLQDYYQESFSPSIFVFVVGAFVALGLVVIVALNRLANSISSKVENETETDTKISQELLFQVLGVFFVVTGLSSMPGVIIAMFKKTPFDSIMLLYTLGDLFQIVTGYYLVIKPKRLGEWMRSFGDRA